MTAAYVCKADSGKTLALPPARARQREERPQSHPRGARAQIAGLLRASIAHEINQATTAAVTSAARLALDVQSSDLEEARKRLVASCEMATAIDVISNRLARADWVAKLAESWKLGASASRRYGKNTRTSPEVRSR